MNRLAFRRALRREEHRGRIEISGSPASIGDELERIRNCILIDAPAFPPPPDPSPAARVVIHTLPSSDMSSCSADLPDWDWPNRGKDQAPAADANPHRAMALARLAKLRQPQPPLPAVDRSRLPVAQSREPCPRCQTRGDLGCDHQRAFEG